MAIAALVLAPAAGAQVHVVADPWAHGGAIGLLVPGDGVTVTRAGALAELAKQHPPAGAEVYLALPPPGRTHNIRRYPIAVVGAGFSGLLTSSATRIPGLVSIRDLDRLSSQPDANPRATLKRLDRRLRQAHDARNGGILVVMFSGLVLAGLALLFRSAWLARAGVLSIPASLSAALVISALGGSRPAVTITALAVLTVAAALGLARLPLPAVVTGFLAVYLVVLAVWSEVNALAIVGPHPDGGGRFYGITNEVETLLLAPVLVAATAWFWPVAVLALANVAWSKAGADGGGILVFAAGLATLRLRLAGSGLTVRRVAAIAVFAVALGLALVGIDAALGGSSHVDRAVGGGPVHVLGVLGHRLRVSWDGVARTWYSALIAALTGGACLMFAFLRPRVAALDALLVALVVSLLVNDSPVDVFGFGALGCAVVWTWGRLAQR
ncbi:MAG: hypothetical protein ACXVZ2_08630 [Gaiellaceae bacterium]